MATAESLLVMGADGWPMLREACLVLEDVLQAHNHREAELVITPGASGVMRGSRVPVGHHEALFSLRVLNRFILDRPAADVPQCRTAMTKILTDLRKGMQAQDARLFSRFDSAGDAARRSLWFPGGL